MNKRNIIWEMGRELLCSLLFPKRCPVCDGILEPEEVKQGIHSACENRLYPIFGAVCMHCGRPIGDNNPKHQMNKYESAREYCFACEDKGYDKQSYLVQAKSLYLYKGAVKQSMYRLKYGNKREYAHFFARQAVVRYADWMRHIGIETIVPVPMYPKKQRRRGYNQAESFAREISRLTGVPVDEKLVCRVLDTPPLKKLSGKERKNNLEKAFHSARNVVQYRCVLVVDDIYTTGTTAEAVARELIKKGAHRVYLMTICIGEDM